MTTLQFRSAAGGDLDAIMAMEVAGFAPGHRESREVYVQRIASFPQGALMALSGSAVAGCVFAELWRPDEALEAAHFTLGHDIRERHDARRGSLLYIASMTLAPDHRGRGLGAALLEGAIAHIARQCPQIDEVCLLVNEAWRSARAIYARAGFAEVMRLTGFFTPDGDTRQDGIVMRRPAAEGVGRRKA